MDEDDEISEVDAGAVWFNRDDGLPAGYTPVFVLGWLNAAMIHGDIR